VMKPKPSVLMPFARARGFLFTGTRKNKEKRK